MTRRHRPSHGAFGRAGARPPAATLTVEPIADYPDMRVLTVDCSHGRTTCTIADARDGSTIPDPHAARLAVWTHYDAEGCGCTAELRRRYGVGS